MDFFNDLGKKFTKAARSVQEFTREGVENTKLTADLRSARSELDRRYADLGRAYYESLADGTGEVPEELISRVRAELETIESLLSQKERARQQVRCPGCGAMQSADARYCSSCGRRMPEDTPGVPETTEDGEAEYCAECGAMRHGHAKYCAVCGYAFDAPSEEPPAVVPAKAEAPAEPCEEPAEHVNE